MPDAGLIGGCYPEPLVPGDELLYAWHKAMLLITLLAAGLMAQAQPMAQAQLQQAPAPAGRTKVPEAASTFHPE